MGEQQLMTPPTPEEEQLYLKKKHTSVEVDLLIQSHRFFAMQIENMVKEDKDRWDKHDSQSRSNWNDIKERYRRIEEREIARQCSVHAEQIKVISKNLEEIKKRSWGLFEKILVLGLGTAIGFIAKG